MGGREDERERHALHSWGDLMLTRKWRNTSKPFELYSGEDGSNTPSPLDIHFDHYSVEMEETINLMVVACVSSNVSPQLFSFVFVCITCILLFTGVCRLLKYILLSDKLVSCG